jgi:hypothetical protein
MQLFNAQENAKASYQNKEAKDGFSTKRGSKVHVPKLNYESMVQPMTQLLLN